MKRSIRVLVVLLLLATSTLVASPALGQRPEKVKVLSASALEPFIPGATWALG